MHFPKSKHVFSRYGEKLKVVFNKYCGPDTNVTMMIDDIRIPRGLQVRNRNVCVAIKLPNSFDFLSANLSTFQGELA